MRNKNVNDSTVAFRVMCAIVFCSFSFVYLFFYQADMLEMMQHVLSKGRTSYEPLMGAVVVTVVLLLLQMAVSRLVRLGEHSYALTFFPSVLLLLLLTDVNGLPLKTVRWGWAVVAIVLWVGVVCLARRLPPVVDSSHRTALVNRPLWINVLMLTVMFLLVGLTAGSNAVFHYRMRAEHCLMTGDERGALKAGYRSLESDSDLTMLRMYALARQGKMGDRLFTYPVAATSRTIIPSEGGTRMLMYPVDSLYHFLGARPKKGMSPDTYLRALLHTEGVNRKAVGDYILCGCLIDRRLDDFVRIVGAFYPVDERLPKHYREALILYTRLRSNPLIDYHNNVMEEDYEGMQELERTYTNPRQRKVKLLEQYGDTYWYYYDYR